MALLKIAVASQVPRDADAIRQLLTPWDITFTGLDDADIVISYGEKPSETKKTLVIPSDFPQFVNWTKEAKLKISRKNEERILSVAYEQTVLTFTPRTQHYYEMPRGSTAEDSTSTEIMLDERQAILTFDVIVAYNRVLDETLNARESRTYRLLTGLPIPYSLAPPQLRDFLMSGDAKSDDLTFSDKLPLDALRLIIVNAIEKLSNRKVSKKRWSGKRFACLLTHDVETKKGLQSAKRLKKLEEKYAIPSAWYVPSEHYKLDHGILEDLANYGEIGAHDTKHDGKLIRLPEQEMVKRLKTAKQALEKLTSCSVRGFRAPLLQHNYVISRALNQAGYEYDTSIPTWEPKHPYTMKSHGIGTVFPFSINSAFEIPVTLPQDHQMIHSMHMNPRQTLEIWSKLIEEIKTMGGLCLLLVHPDYELADVKNQRTYEELLNSIANSDASVTLPGNLKSGVPNRSFPQNELITSQKHG